MPWISSHIRRSRYSCCSTRPPGVRNDPTWDCVHRVRPLHYHELSSAFSRRPHWPDNENNCLVFRIVGMYDLSLPWLQRSNGHIFERAGSVSSPCNMQHWVYFSFRICLYHTLHSKVTNVMQAAMLHIDDPRFASTTPFWTSGTLVRCITLKISVKGADEFNIKNILWQGVVFKDLTNAIKIYSTRKSRSIHLPENLFTIRPALTALRVVVGAKSL